MKVKIKRLHEDAAIPKKAHPTDAGFDLVATSRVFGADGAATTAGLAPTAVCVSGDGSSRARRLAAGLRGIDGVAFLHLLGVSSRQHS